jgi:hypothetical protein
MKYPKDPKRIFLKQNYLTFFFSYLNWYSGTKLVFSHVHSSTPPHSCTMVKHCTKSSREKKILLIIVMIYS